jgi:phosphoglycolate phosphatase-like HAD superfamily hydrolase
MSRKTYLFLDFDGVICDSVDECLVSSWLAYNHHLLPVPSNQMSLEFRRLFAQIRPFIRSGEDYVLIQKLLDSGAEITTQKQFDAYLEDAGTEQMKSYGEIFYKARGQLLDENPDYWLSLNRLYPHVDRTLRRVAGDERVYVMSTKKAPFIVRILQSKGIPMDPERVIWSGSRVKVDVISEILERLHGPSNAVLVDDQIDHLIKPRAAEVDVRLALWGYVKPEWRDGYPDVVKLDQADWDAFIQEWEDS